MSSRRPDYELKAYNKTNERYCYVGAGWINEDDSVSIVLNPCVMLTPDADVLLMLFPVDKKHKKGSAGE